jgi:hypothetical protein
MPAQDFVANPPEAQPTPPVSAMDEVSAAKMRILEWSWRPQRDSQRKAMKRPLFMLAAALGAGMAVTGSPALRGALWAGALLAARRAAMRSVGRWLG